MTELRRAIMHFRKTKPLNLDVTILKAKAENKIKVQEFFIENFFGHSPLHQAFHMHEIPPPDKFVTYTDDNKDFALLAVNSKTNIIGVGTVEQQYPPWLDPLKSENITNYLGVFEFAKKQAMPEHFVDTTEMHFLAVSPEGRNKGVGKRLVEECAKTAQELGFKTMYMCCVSEFTARLARSLGWREHYCLPYNDYGKLSGTGVIVNTPSPHKYLRYYVTDL